MVVDRLVVLRTGLAQAIRRSPAAGCRAVHMAVRRVARRAAVFAEQSGWGRCIRWSVAGL